VLLNEHGFVAERRNFKAKVSCSNIPSMAELNEENTVAV
jgi:hypothetical protein